MPLVRSLGLGAIAAPRVSVAVAALLVPTTLVGHLLWREAGPGPRSQQRIRFFETYAYGERSWS